MSEGLAIIIGSGFARLNLEVLEERAMVTPFGSPSNKLLRVDIGGNSAWCLPRHGSAHHLPPHAVNYRANIWALDALGIQRVIAVNWVGSIDPAFAPGTVAVPDQLIDYTSGRPGTFFDGRDARVLHVDFTEPFAARVRADILRAGRDAGFAMIDGGVYGVTQGPRLETAAEIDRLQRDGCTMVGMTAMPEAALARELSLPYGVCALSVNHAAGRSPDGEPIHDQTEVFFAMGLKPLRALLAAVAGNPSSAGT